MTDRREPLYLIWCRVCTPTIDAGNAQPFDSPQKRGLWATEHAKSHDTAPTWFVIDLPAVTTEGAL